MQNNTTALIVAAGRGKRFGGAVSKQFLRLSGVPILHYVLSKFQASSLIDHIIIVLPQNAISAMTDEIMDWNIGKLENIVAGGEERHHSVQNGLLAAGPRTQWVAIHDGVRPMVTVAQIDETIRAAYKHGAAILAAPARDTIKEAADGTVCSTLDRSQLFHAQTPQVFRKEEILEAYRRAFASGTFSTDDASLVERLGIPVKIVIGDHRNMKITSAEDLCVMEALMKEQEQR